MRKAVSVLMGAIALMVVAAGCYYAPGGITASTTPLEGRKYQIIGPVEETDSAFYILGVIPVSGMNTTADTVDYCLNKTKGDAMIDVTVDWSWHFYFAVTRHVTIVRGKAIKFTDDKK